MKLKFKTQIKTRPQKRAHNARQRRLNTWMPMFAIYSKRRGLFQ